MMTSICLPELPIARYRFDLALQQTATLPAYLGALLRGGFGLAFKNLVCLQKQLPDCRSCLLLYTCTYPILFEAVPPREPAVLKTHDRIPAPYVLAPPPIHAEPWSAGEVVHFQLTLIGRGILHLPYFVLAFRQLGEVGLGKQRTPARLQTVWAVNGTTGQAEALWQGGRIRTDWQQQGQWFPLSEDDSEISFPSLTLHFLTPTRLKYEDTFVQTPPPFHVVIRTLLRRVSSLSYFHGGQRWETDYRYWIAQAETVQLTQADVHWADWERYSTRQHQRMNLGGIMGQVTYTGDLAPFLPLLRLGELIHVGKGAVFGNGQYRVGVE